MASRSQCNFKVYFLAGEISLNNSEVVTEGANLSACVNLRSSGNHLGCDINVTLDTKDGKAGMLSSYYYNTISVHFCNHKVTGTQL